MTPLWPIGWRHLNWSQISVRRLRKMVGFDSKTNPADPLAIPFGIEKWPRMRCVHWIAPARPIEEGGGGRDKGVSCCPRTLSCARVRGACGRINLSSDDALDVLQISCRSRARSREGFSRGWAEAPPHPGPYRVDTSCGSHRWRDFFSLSALKAGQSHMARRLPFSPLSFPRKRASVPPNPLPLIVPAESENRPPKTRHPPLDSRLRGNDGNREVGEPKCHCPAPEGPRG